MQCVAFGLLYTVYYLVYCFTADFISFAAQFCYSVCIRRLRAEGYQVVDRPRPRERDDSLSTNYGGVVAVAFTGARLKSLVVGVNPKTFELFLCVRVTSGTESCILGIIYRPRSIAVTSALHALSDVLDRLSTFVEPVYIAGDVNVRLDRPDDPAADVQLFDVLADHGLSRRVNEATQ